MGTNGNMKNKTKNVFDWVKHINQYKTPPKKFSDEDWDKNFNSYVVHKVLSMNPNFLELVNEVQTLPPTNKKEIYSIYREFIPKNKQWYKYIKSKTKLPNKDLIESLKNYYNLSSREVIDYIKILDKRDIKNLLVSLGKDKKEIKKLIK